MLKALWDITDWEKHYISKGFGTNEAAAMANASMRDTAGRFGLPEDLRTAIANQREKNVRSRMKRQRIPWDKAVLGETKDLIRRGYRPAEVTALVQRYYHKIKFAVDIAVIRSKRKRQKRAAIKRAEARIRELEEQGFVF